MKKILVVFCIVTLSFNFSICAQGETKTNKTVVKEAEEIVEIVENNEEPDYEAFKQFSNEAREITLNKLSWKKEYYTLINGCVYKNKKYWIAANLITGETYFFIKSDILKYTNIKKNEFGKFKERVISEK